VHQRKVQTPSPPRAVLSQCVDPDDRGQLRQQINSLLERVAASPTDVAVHEQLRTAALRHTVAGSRPLGLLATLRPVPRDPLRRLLHFERLAAFDPGNVGRLVQVWQAVELLASSRPHADFEPVRRWITRIIRALRPR
jgi:hypothetical protein